MLHFASNLSEATHLKSDLSTLKSLAESCSRQLRAWADSLQNSDIKGQRHLTDATRRQYDARRRATEFQQRLDTLLRTAHPERYPQPEEQLSAAIDQTKI